VLRRTNSSYYIHGPSSAGCDCWEYKCNGEWEGGSTANHGYDGCPLNCDGCQNYTNGQNFIFSEEEHSGFSGGGKQRKSSVGFIEQTG
jgi:pyruvate-formate lyase-activating enzyme